MIVAIPIPTPEQVAEAKGARVDIHYQGLSVVAAQPYDDSGRERGPTVPLPPEMKAMLSAKFWDGGETIYWDRDACILGGYVETESGSLFPVDGGFCFNADSLKWRAVRLSAWPKEFSGIGLPHRPPGERRECRTVLIANERALDCWYHSGENIGAQCGFRMPPVELRGTYRLIGLH